MAAREESKRKRETERQNVRERERERVGVKPEAVREGTCLATKPSFSL